MDLLCLPDEGGFHDHCGGVPGEHQCSHYHYSEYVLTTIIPSVSCLRLKHKHYYLESDVSVTVAALVLIAF